MENWKGIVGTNCSACTAINTQIVINLWMKKAEFIFNHGYCILEHMLQQAQHPIQTSLSHISSM